MHNIRPSPAHVFTELSFSSNSTHRAPSKHQYHPQLDIAYPSAVHPVFLDTLSALRWVALCVRVHCTAKAHWKLGSHHLNDRTRVMHHGPKLRCRICSEALTSARALFSMDRVSRCLFNASRLPGVASRTSCTTSHQSPQAMPRANQASLHSGHHL